LKRGFPAPAFFAHPNAAFYPLPERRKGIAGRGERFLAKGREKDGAPFKEEWENRDSKFPAGRICMYYKA
jgi:hypothetical protein